MLDLPVNEQPSMTTHFPHPSPFLDLTQRTGMMSRREIGELTRSWSGSRLTVAAGILYLWNDHWEAAHEIAQSDEGEPDHDFLHGILHRREGDFGNAAYWFRSAGAHPCRTFLATRIRQVLADRTESWPATWIVDDVWQPLAFNQSVRTRGRDDEDLLRAVQAAEMISFHDWLKDNA